MSAWVLVMVGGGLGAVSRYLLGGWLGGLLGGLWWGTLAVNLLGCFGLGAVWASVDRWGGGGHGVGVWVVPLLMSGFLGGFTTLSGLQKDVWQLVQAEAWGMVLLYSGASWLGGLLCLLLGKAWIAGVKV